MQKALTIALSLTAALALGGCTSDQPKDQAATEPTVTSTEPANTEPPAKPKPATPHIIKPGDGDESGNDRAAERRATNPWLEDYHLIPDAMCDNVHAVLRRIHSHGIEVAVREEPGEESADTVTNLTRFHSAKNLLPILWVGGTNRPSCHPD